jgi:4'-phosphopantetheinyl transferase
MAVPGYQFLSPACLLTSAEDESGMFAPTPGVLCLWLLAVPAPFPEALLLGLLDASERARADRFHRPEDRSRFVAAHGQARLVLAASGAGRAEKLCFATEETGKPRLAGGPVTFNLSHSGDWAALAVAASDEVGVDIEAMRPFDDMTDFASRTFAPGEAAELALLPPQRREEGFFACWTRKEAILKADGRGLGLPLKSFEVSVDPDAPPRVRRAVGPGAAVGAFRLWDLPPISGHRAAAAAAVDLRPEFLRLG